jgi:hypothetical protein
MREHPVSIGPFKSRVIEKIDKEASKQKRSKKRIYRITF